MSRARSSRSRSPRRMPSPDPLLSAHIAQPALIAAQVQDCLPSALANIVGQYAVCFTPQQLQALFTTVGVLVGHAHTHSGGPYAFATDVKLLGALLTSLSHVLTVDFLVKAISQGLNTHFDNDVPEVYRSPVIRRYGGYQQQGCPDDFDLRVCLEQNLADAREARDGFFNDLLTFQIDELMDKLK